MRELQTADVSLFWYWMNERHRIYLKRAAGEPKPWTDDPILRHYKFTNVYRQLDRGTVWLTENFIEPHINDDSRLIAANICWYRMFNWWGTGELLGWQTIWDSAYIRKTLTEAMERGRQVFTNAHIIYSPPGMSKIDAIVDVSESLWRSCFDVAFPAVYGPMTNRSLEETFEFLQLCYCVGGFMAYEMVTDMRHVPGLLDQATDIMTWANPGPGAIRGLRRLGMPYKPRAAAIKSIETLMIRANDRWPHPGVNDGAPPPKRLEDWMEPLEMRDVEHSLCEFDKYCRVKFNEGEPRMRFDGGA